MNINIIAVENLEMWIYIILDYTLSLKLDFKEINLVQDHCMSLNHQKPMSEILVTKQYQKKKSICRDKVKKL